MTFCSEEQNWLTISGLSGCHEASLLVDVLGTDSALTLSGCTVRLSEVHDRWLVAYSMMEAMAQVP